VFQSGVELDHFLLTNPVSLIALKNVLHRAAYPVCQTCHVLLNSLEDARNRLDAAMLRMRSVVGTRRPEEFRAALLEWQSLRMECRALRAEVEHHKEQHHQRSTQD
jgi:hypothetical protein